MQNLTSPSIVTTFLIDPHPTRPSLKLKCPHLSPDFVEALKLFDHTSKGRFGARWELVHGPHHNGDVVRTLADRCPPHRSEEEQAHLQVVAAEGSHYGRLPFRFGKRWGLPCRILCVQVHSFSRLPHNPQTLNFFLRGLSRVSACLSYHQMSALEQPKRNVQGKY